MHVVKRNFGPLPLIGAVKMSPPTPMGPPPKSGRQRVSVRPEVERGTNKPERPKRNDALCIRMTRELRLAIIQECRRRGISIAEAQEQMFAKWTSAE